MSEIDPSGRVTIVKGGELLLPAQCLMCGVSGSDVEEEFLDIKRALDEYGVIYFCLECGEEIGLASGSVPRRSFEAIAIANEQLTEENEKYESMLDRLGDGLERDILDYLARRGISVPTSSSDDSASEDVVNETDGDDELFVDFYDGSSGDSAESDSGSAELNSESAELDTSDGPVNTDELADSNSSYFPKLEL